MANPTTNYSFAMPTNTDLVKDLPADFDIFGQAVDDRIKALNPETTAGDLAYRASTANAKTRLAIGTAGQVLTVNSGATAPEWTTISGGGLTLLSTTTLTGTSTTLSSISQDYVHLYLRIVGAYNSVTADTRVTLSINNDNDEHYWGMYGVTDSSATATGASNQGNVQLGRSSTSATLANKNYSATTIYNYTSTDPRMIAADAYGVNGGAYWYQHTTGIYMGTSACTSLVIAMQGSSISGGTAYLYGVK
jgi:hypothetical protein